MLKSLIGLQDLSLGRCPALQNVDGLKRLAGLQWLWLDDCPALQNVDVLKGLTNLVWLDLRGCRKISAAAQRELSAALPKTSITFPDLADNPPQ
jgi:hypothetical protein